ncbi:MAG: ComEC/Rec2 family competence protein, partial [Gemmatimonadota bacterium]
MLIILGIRGVDPRLKGWTDILLSPIVLLPTLAAAGAFSGARTASALRASCEAELETGTAVVVHGHMIERAGGSRQPGRSAGLRVSLEDVVVSTSEGECWIPRLAAFIASEDATELSEPRLDLEGEWLRLKARSPDGPGLDIPGRTGIVVAAHVTGRVYDASASDDGLTARFRATRRAIRSAAADRLRARLSPDVDVMGRALLLAERDELTSDVRRRFADAGLAHLLAISGLHVGIIGGLILALLRTFVRGPRLYLLAAGLVGLYVVVLGAPTPALRASLLFSGWAVSRFIGRPVRGADLPGAAALVFL